MVSEPGLPPHTFTLTVYKDEQRIKIYHLDRYKYRRKD